jgi:hypothetical protein
MMVKKRGLFQESGELSSGAMSKSAFFRSSLAPNLL